MVKLIHFWDYFTPYRVLGVESCVHFSGGNKKYKDSLWPSVNDPSLLEYRGLMKNIVTIIHCITVLEMVDKRGGALEL